MLHGNETLADLAARFPRAGTVRWIGLRTAPRGEVHAVRAAQLIAGRGLDGDHRARRAGGRRQVTLIQAEHLDVVAALLGRHTLDARVLRRNVVVQGINLAALKGRRFRVGEALLEGTGWCHPCSRMEQVLGRGGYNAMRGHGGITALVLEDGAIALGDTLSVG